MKNTNQSQLPRPLDAERHDIRDVQAGHIVYYSNAPSPRSSTIASPADETPLLLLHSINAAASAHEVKPLYDAYTEKRPVYAIDLPGYGASERSKRPYLPQLMVDAIHAIVRDIQSRHPGKPIDALAVSLSCEFLARVAYEKPEAIRSLALVSSTGFRQTTATHGPPQANRGRPVLYRLLNSPLYGTLLFRVLTSPPSIRLFLRKTSGSKHIDEGMFEFACRTAREPGAHRAPFHFLSGYLTSADIRSIFIALTQPVWLCHGVRGDFTDFSRTEAIEHKPNWKHSVFQTGALPYFEEPRAFIEDYDSFLAEVEAGRPVNASVSG